MRILNITLLASSMVLVANIAQAKSLPNFDIKGLCGSDKGCARTQKDFKKTMKEDGVWNLISKEAQEECESIARASNSNGDYWLLSDCAYENLK